MADKIDTDTKKLMLRKQPCFSQLREEEIEILASLLVEKHVSPGEIIVKEGDPVDSVYLIVSGKADVRCIKDRNHPDQTESVATLIPGDAIGLNETGFYSLSGIRTATVIAIDEMVLLRLSVAAFHGFALAYSHVNEVMRSYARKLLGMNT
ncbi:cyclic nucleotide-binding domain-containing protein [Aquicella lusitana]|nr:cyclic nucleotide-binding domain-containing protein [Aquicella lusitana]VVC74373.1 hypothetical protein AQULUS_21390 [Aquicella lusitana]